MVFAFVLFAGEQANQGQGGAPGWFTFLPMVAILFLLYWMMIRPARRQENERQTMLKAMKVRDKVVTAGGLIGTVAAIKENEDEVTLKIDENSNVKVRVTKSSIVRVLNSAEGGKEPKEGGA
jgi:preprotein translocase subunit YajC